MGKGRVMLAYSGGLDTSTILKWLLEQGYEVVCFLANVGQEEDFEKVRSKAVALGAKKMIIEDLRKEFLEDFIFRAVQCNAIYEGRYLLGTSLARPVIARAMLKYALEEKCDAFSHGCTGKGNDQIRFENAWNALSDLKVIAPWREPEFINRFQGRSDLLAYAAEKGIPVEQTSAKPWSMDDNLQHCSYEAGKLEEPSTPVPAGLWTRTVDPEKAPDTPEDITIKFSKGVPVELKAGGKTFTDSLELFIQANALGKKHGIGRIDIVENRFIGLKSRGCYDAPGATLLRLAHLDLECLVMDSKVMNLRDVFVTPQWSNVIYNGLYFSPEREFLENSLLWTQDVVNGEVNCRLYKGNVTILSRSSPNSLYDAEQASMDSLDGFSPLDTTGFININGIRLKKYGQMKRSQGHDLLK